MAQPYVGEIRMFAGNFAPAGWMFCDGQSLPIAENETLFQLLGTTYGGNGNDSFGLPNLQSRIPIHQGTAPNGTTYQLAENAGTEQETLGAQQIPIHTHQATGSNSLATQNTPGGAMFAQSVGQAYAVVSPITMSPQTITGAGGSQPHENVQPFLCINYIISLFGIFPSQT